MNFYNGDILRKAIVPTCIILALASLICFFVAKEYLTKQRADTLNKLANKNAKQQEVQTEEGAVVSEERLTMNDTVLLLKKDLDKKELTLKNIEGGSEKVLTFDGTTKISTKRGGALTASELNVGEMYDITFTTYNHAISEISQATSVWSNKNITNYEIDDKARTIKVGDDLFELRKDIVVVSEDKLAEVMDITALDSITLYGIDKSVYSIIINSGHGYIRVTNDSYFVGGWIEIGQDIIKVLTEDMLIPVPEGRYDIKVTHKGYVGRDTIDVNRDKETKLDLSKVDIEEVAIGHVKFNVTPDYGQLYVDGLMTDFDERVPLEYGIHSVRAELAGYETVSFNIKVGSELANVDVELEKEEVSDSSSSTSSSSSDLPNSQNTAIPNDSQTGATTSSSSENVNSGNTVLSDNKKIFVEGPAGAEVYLDGTYIGVAPCNTNKVTGSHTITLAKSGCETKSYTINVSTDGNDLTLSFSDLTKTGAEN